MHIIIYLQLIIKIIIIFTLIVILYKINYYSIENFYVDDSSVISGLISVATPSSSSTSAISIATPSDPISASSATTPSSSSTSATTPTPSGTVNNRYNFNPNNIVCGSTNNLLDTTCRILKDNIAITEKAISNPYEKRLKTIDKYNYYINSDKNTPLMKNAVDILYNIKLDLGKLTKLNKMNLYILPIIQAFNKNVDLYNNAIKNTPLNPVTSSYSISDALTDTINLYNNEAIRYRISLTYSLKTLTNIQTKIKNDYQNLTISLYNQTTQYNELINTIISNGHHTKLPYLEPNSSINSVSLILDYVNKIYISYRNSNTHFTNAINDEAISLTNNMNLFNTTYLLIINYFKALIGISETIEPTLLNIKEIVY